MGMGQPKKNSSINFNEMYCADRHVITGPGPTVP